MKGNSSVATSAATVVIDDNGSDKGQLDRVITGDENHQQFATIDETTDGNVASTCSVETSKCAKGSVTSAAQAPSQSTTTIMMSVGAKHILPRPQGLSTLAAASNGSMTISASSLNGSLSKNVDGNVSSNRQRRSSVSTSNSIISNGGSHSKRTSSSAASSADLQDLSAGNSQQPFSNPQYTGCRYDVAKPPYSYASLIAQALLAAPQRQLTLNQIYQWIMEKYPYYHSENSGWQNSIRHNLSLNSCFVKLAKSEKDHVGKGAFWTINEEEIDMLNNGTFKRRKLTGADGTSKSRRKRRGSSSNTSNAMLRERNSSTSNSLSCARIGDEYGLSGGDLLTGSSFAFGAAGNYGGDRISYYTHPDAAGLSGSHAAGAAYGPMARSITDWEGDFPADLDIIESVLGRPVSNASSRKQNSSSSLAALPAVSFDGANYGATASGLLYHGMRRNEDAANSTSSSVSLMMGHANHGGASWSGTFSHSNQHIPINDPQINGAFAHMRQEDISRAFLAATAAAASSNSSTSRGGSMANVNDFSVNGLAQQHSTGMFGNVLMQSMGLQSTEDLTMMMASHGNVSAPNAQHPGASVYSMQSASHNNVLQQSPSLQSIQQSLFNHPMSNGPMPVFSHHQHNGSSNAANASAGNGVLAPPSSTLWELQRSAAEVRTDQTDPLEYFG